MPAHHAADPWTRIETQGGFRADEVISALQKEIRRGNVDNAVMLAYEMISTSPEMEAKLWQRLKVISVEDVGYGDIKAPMLIHTLDSFHNEFERGAVDRVLFAIHAVRYLAESVKDRSSDELSQWVARSMESGSVRPDIPDYALDQHTAQGQEMGRGRRHFYEEASQIIPELPERQLIYRQRLMETLEDES